jgi:hypothetical protein
MKWTGRIRKDIERSLLKTMGPMQRELFTTLCTTRMTREPIITELMTGLTMSKTPQKAISLLQSETRDWEGTFSVGRFHRMLLHGFMSNHEANQTNPGGSLNQRNILYGLLSARAYTYHFGKG